ncbi:DUF6223 family protein [Nocardia sp. CA-119907]|uniref:DUF6223 family protein n=1 Tax=Nocardia sp. CA-119907 TaxID=3239973 RepID=UPI003D996D6B
MEAGAANATHDLSCECRSVEPPPARPRAPRIAVTAFRRLCRSSWARRRIAMFIHHLSAAPAAAHVWVAVGGYGPSSGRFGAMVAAVVALTSVAVGVLAVVRSRRGTGRIEAILAQALGLTGVALGVWHWARSAAGFGTGNGRAGAIVAVVIALAGIVLGGLTLARAHRTVAPSTDPKIN